MITVKKFYPYIIMLCCIANSFAQTGSIEGTITDPYGTPLEYVNVILSNTQKGTTTDANGNYSFAAVEDGEYTLTASYMSYMTSKKNVMITSGGNIKVDFVLEEINSQLDEVIVSSVGRTPEKLSEIPASITVVSSEQIKTLSTNTTHINDVLEFAVPGLAPSSGTYSNWGQTLRGRQLLVLVDGIPQSTPLRNSLVDLKSVQPYDIDRIEVIKGSAAIYGNGGDGGIVNYITKKTNKDALITGTSNAWTTSNLSKTDDAFGWGLQQSLTGNLDKFSYYVSGSFEKTGNKYDANRDPLSPTYGLDNSKIFSVLGKIGYQINDKQTINAMINHYNSRQDSPFVPTRGELEVFNASGDRRITPVIGVLPTDENPKLGDDTGVTTTNAQIKYTLNEIFNGTTKLDADLYYQKGKNIFFYSEYFENGGQTVVNTDKFGFRPILHTDLHLDIPVKMSFTYGLDLLKDKTNQGLLDGRIWTPDLDLLSIAPFVQAKFKYKEDWVLKTGIRHDDMRIVIDDFSTLPYSPRRDGNFRESADVSGGDLSFRNTSINAGIRYIKNNEFIPYFSFSQGFSLPDIGRVIRGATANSVDDINPSPIITNNYEFGFLSKFKHVRFEAVGYYSTSNLGLGLVFNDDSNRFEQSENPQNIYGAEVSADFTFLHDNLQFGASYSYVEGLKHSPDDSTNLTYIGGDVISPPKITAYINVRPFSKLSTSIRVLHVGSRKRFNPTETDGTFSFRYREVPVHDYALVNFSSTYEATEKISISLGINNLFNKDFLPARSQWASPLRGQIPAGEGINGRLAISYKF
ncbi:TonB-dependent receptor [Aquimarina aquimarini]|uniref:TonB-dependent receptor n=1 Tax=Aquimarina aquimarini TaxID=1191734 RepID=UPI001F3CFE3F|nr:TonB-dependent receptor [Aquimarina aquimarini]